MSVNLQTAENVDVPENNSLLKEIGVIQAAEKIEEIPESELKTKEEPIQLGLFDSYTATQSDEQNNSESVATLDFDEALDAPTENMIEENTATLTESVDSEPVEEISVSEMTTDTAADEQNNSDYDFEEIDEEEEILPSTIEKQNNVEILPQEDSQAENISSEPNSEPISEQNQTLEEDFTTETLSEDATSDLQTILAEDMVVIRGNSVEKNILRKNVIAIRTLQQIEREKRPATPEEVQVLKEYAGFGGIPKAFDKNNPNWNREAWLLYSMLTGKEYNVARGSILNVHYISGEVVQGIYNGLGCVGKLKMANKSGKKNEIQETNIELVESDCDVTKFFNALEKAFDNVTLFVKLSIEIMFYDSITFVGDANNRAMTGKIVTNLFGAESFICKNFFTRQFDSFKQFKSRFTVMNLSAG